MAQLSIRKVSKFYENRVKGLQDIDLEIQKGEFVVLVGPSGCGKSTLLRTIAGLETPTSGTIEIAGRRVENLPPAERGVAMVFQDYALYPHMSVRENLSFGLRMQKLNQATIQSRLEKTTGMLGLEGLLDRKPAQLSGGQRQRVAIGRALVKEPSLFLLDEPLSNLDAQLRAQTRIELAALHRRLGSTTLYVTHDQEEAMTLADRIAILNQGLLQQFGPPLELYRKPANRFVASFIGNPRMNFLEGQLRRKDRRWIFDFEGIEVDVTGAPALPEAGGYTLGFRPEAIRLGGTFPVTLTWVELHGFEIHVVAQVKDRQLIFRTADLAVAARFEKARPGSHFQIEIDPTQLHWFSQETDEPRVSDLIHAPWGE